MKTIYKYEFPIRGEFFLKLPEGAKPLTAFVQVPNKHSNRRSAMLWAEVDTEAKPTDYMFMVVGTGNPIPIDATKYIATFTDGPFVWHLYGEG